MTTWILNHSNNYSHQPNYQRRSNMIKKSTMKKAAPKKPVKKAPARKSAKKTAVVDPSITNLLTAKCRTISGKSELTYNIAEDEKGITLIRIASNSGGGYWSREYVSFDAITSALEAIPEGNSITSIHLFKLFTGKSSNTPGFLLAVLLKDGVLEPLGKKRQYKLSDEGVDKFMAKVEKLKQDKAQ